MHDENHHKDSLERLFYKKSAEYEIPFREEDWLSLEKRLDIHDLQRSYRNKFRFLAAAAILIFTLFGYFTLDNYNRLNMLSDQLELESSPDMQFHLPDNSLSPAAELDQPSLADRDDPSFETESAGAIAATAHEPAAEFLNLSHAQISAFSMMEHRSLESELINSTNRELHVLPEFKNLIFSTDTKTQLYADLEGNGDHYAVLEGNGYHSIRETMYSARSLAGTPDHIRGSRLGFGFALSPDISSTGMASNYGDIGYRIGVKGEYRISDNLYLTAGILASNVNYSTTGRRYNPPQYWNNGVNPDNTTAICLILDIPLGVKYNMMHLDESRFFATAGIASYIMLNEDYRFDYETNFSGLETSYEVKNGSRHLFNNISLSVGYEIELFSNWNVRAEPFINIPVSGVGWGDVKLYSIGSYVSINYQL